jgi:hypothetical protein
MSRYGDPSSGGRKNSAGSQALRDKILLVLIRCGLKFYSVSLLIPSAALLKFLLCLLRMVDSLKMRRKSRATVPLKVYF